MQASISHFTTTIICIMMIVLMIKMILPEDKNKKYILFLCGTITTIVLMEPLMAFMKIDMSEVFASNQTEFETLKANDRLFQEAVQNSYEQRLVEDILQRLQENGYSVSHARVEYDSNYQPTKIYLRLGDKDGYVQPVKIEVTSQEHHSTVSELTENHIKDILQKNYGIAKSNIWIEGGK